ncbi:uncharacterized protein METZ01_LOCUS395547, partial [marine metagenome]
MTQHSPPSEALNANCCPSGDQNKSPWISASIRTASDPSAFIKYDS